MLLARCSYSILYSAVYAPLILFCFSLIPVFVSSLRNFFTELIYNRCIIVFYKLYCMPSIYL